MTAALHLPRPVHQSRFCFACGTEHETGLKLQFVSLEPGRVHAEHSVCQRFSGHPGVVHGGILATILDEALGAALLSVHPDRFALTANLSVRYLQPVHTNVPIRCEAEITDRHRWRVHVDGVIRLHDGSAAVTARGVLVTPPWRRPGGFSDV